MGLWDNLTDYYNQSQVGNQATASMAQSVAAGQTPASMMAEMNTHSAIGSIMQHINTGLVDPSVAGAAVSQGVSNSSSSASSANEAYKELYEATGDTSWIEKYIDNLVSQENTASARQWEEEMSNTQFSRMVEDILNAGYNPWIALQSGLGQSSVPSTSAAGTSGVSGSSQATSKANEKAGNESQIFSRIISAVGVAIGALIYALL